MALETLKTGDIVYLKNNPDLPLVVLFIKGEDITVLFPDGVTQNTLPKIAFANTAQGEYHVTLHM